MAQTNKVPNFQRMARALLQAMPQEVAQQARAFFQASFIKEGFTDTSFIPWVKRHDSLAHKLLSKSLALRNSIRVETANHQKIEISAGKGIPYAAIHNQGGTITVRITPKSRKFFWYKFKTHIFQCPEQF